MINETINATAHPVGNVVNNFWNYISVDLANRGTDIVMAPVHNTNMLWILLPLLATLIFMEFYFGRYKNEELGWNTAYGNALILLFVSIDLLRTLYGNYKETIWQFIITMPDTKIIIPLVIAGMGLVLIFVDFFHILPTKIAYALSSPAYINLIGLLGIIIVYIKDIPLDWTTVLACLVLFIMANLLMLVLYYIIPSYHPTIKKILTSEDMDEEAEVIEKSKKRK